MMQGFAAHPEVRATFDEASAVLGFDLWALVENGPAEDLNQTINTQPAMLVADVAVWRAWCAAGGETPAYFAGHSLGEYAALVAAGALDFADAVRLVRLRAEAMQVAVPDGVGAMAAILGLADDAVRAACAEAAGDEVCEAVNFNSPGQVVIAGNHAAVARAMLACKAAGAKRALPLPVSVPSHSSLMHGAAEVLGAALALVDLRSPSVPVLHNTDVDTHCEAGAIRAALARQLHTPVRWAETVQALAANGVVRVIECGPGKVLTGLSKRIVDGVTSVALIDDASLAGALAPVAAAA
jgi:[acyl-carrier-protein] S-malonyltransferase